MSKRWLTLVAAVLLAALLVPTNATAAPSWFAPQRLTGADTLSEVKTAMGTDGTVVTAATRVGDDGIRQIVASVRRPGRSFTPPQVLITAGPGGAAILNRVSVSPTGRFAISFARGGGTSLEVSFLRADDTFSPPTVAPDDLYWSTSRLSAYDAASTMYFARPYRTDDQLGTVEVLRADDSRATLFFPMTGFDTSESDMAIAVAPDGHFTVLYTTQAKQAGADCGTQRLFAIDGTAAGVGTPRLLAEHAPASYPGHLPACVAASITGLSVLRLADGTFVAAYGETTPPAAFDGEGQQRLALVSRAPGATTWSAPQGFANSVGITKLTLAGTTPVLTVFDSRASENLVSVRRGDGSWTTPVRVGTGGSSEYPNSVIGRPDGSSEVVYADVLTEELYARSVAADGTLSAAPRLLLGGFRSIALISDGVPAGSDGQGNGVVAGVSTVAGETSIVHIPFDGAPPVLTDLAIPASGQTGTPLDFPATAFDVWGPVTLSWTYGDGATGTGGPHAYANAGQFPVTVTATDAVGNTSTKSGAVTISTAAGSGPEPARDRTAPRFTAKPRVTPARPTLKKAARLTFALDEAATVTAVVQQKTQGIKRTAKGKCVKAPKTKPKGAKRCTLLVTRTTRTGAFKVGKGTIQLPKTLKVGSYTLAITATDAAGNFVKATASFTVRAAKTKRGS